MLRRSTLLALPLALGLVAFVLPQQGGRPQKSELTEQMQKINAGLRQATRGWQKEGGVQAAMGQLLEVEQAILRSKQLVPAMLEGEADADKKTKALMHYRKEMNELLRAFLDLEDAIMAGDEAAIDAAREKLADVKDEGHAEFKPARKR